MTEFFEILKAILFGIVEGITEWLPVSSTGHIILLDEFVRLNVAPALGTGFAEEYMSMFEVVIQLGAILAVVVLFFNKLNPFSASKSTDEKKETWLLWLKVVIASVPAAIVGLVLDKVIENITGKDIDGWLYNFITVAVMLILYGVLFIAVEIWQKKKILSAKLKRTARLITQRSLRASLLSPKKRSPASSRSLVNSLRTQPESLKRSYGLPNPMYGRVLNLLSLPLLLSVHLSR